MADTDQSGEQHGWDVTLYSADINSYVDQCPIHLFDTQTNRNIPRSELKDNISAALRRWMELPLTCSEIVEAMFTLLPHYIQSGFKGMLRAYIYTAMAKSPLVDGEACFISAIRGELLPSRNRNLYTQYHVHSSWLDPMIQAVQDLIERKRAQASRPSHQEVREQIAMLGQYAILSHCWDQDNSQELIFDDVAHISDPRVLAKSGFSKLQGFTKVVKSRYGCRYLWMDTACIEETDREYSIPLMFGWYRHAYICVVYLSTSAILGDRWVTRGWTLQELLAADKIVFFTNSWVRLKAEDVLGSKFHACREILSYSSVYEQLKEIIGYLDWAAYQPGVDQALDVLFAMRARETTKPEDRVYSLLSSLNISISIEYGEGFERAFYRLQAEILIQGQDRRLLLWKGWKGWESSYNSMLSNHFDSWLSGDFEEYRSSKYSSSFDPTITFDSNNVMRIMVFLYRLYSSPSHVFMLLGRYTHSSSYVGILLWEFPGNIYRRIGYKEHNSRISFDKPPEWIYIK